MLCTYVPKAGAYRAKGQRRGRLPPDRNFSLSYHHSLLFNIYRTNKVLVMTYPAEIEIYKEEELKVDEGKEFRFSSF